VQLCLSGFVERPLKISFLSWWDFIQRTDIGYSETVEVDAKNY